MAPPPKAVAVLRRKKLLPNEPALRKPSPWFSKGDRAGGGRRNVRWGVDPEGRGTFATEEEHQGMLLPITGKMISSRRPTKRWRRKWLN